MFVYKETNEEYMSHTVTSSLLSIKLRPNKLSKKQMLQISAPNGLLVCDENYNGGVNLLSYYNAVGTSDANAILDFLLFLLSGVHLVPLTFPSFRGTLLSESGPKGDESTAA